MATLARSIARAGYKITKILLLKSCQSFEFCQIGEISPNMVTLPLIKGGFFVAKKAKSRLNGPILKPIFVQNR